MSEPHDVKIDHVDHYLMPVDENPMVEIRLCDGRIIYLEIESETTGSLMVTYPKGNATHIDLKWKATENQQA